MSAVTVKTSSGKSAGSVDLNPALFAVEPNVGLMHQVVTAQLAARRSGTHSTKTRSEVSGGGRKPWKQKGTGRARAGSTRSPIWVGGGIAHGPKPRDYSQRTNKKMIKLALAGALSDRAAEDRVVVIDQWDFAQPKTKDAIAALGALGVEGKILIILERDDVNAWKSFANLTNVHVLAADQLNVYDILVSDYVVFTKSTLPGGDDIAADAKPAAKKAPAKKAAAAEAEASPEPADAPEAEEAGADAAPTKKKAAAKKTAAKKAPAKKAAAKKAEPEAATDTDATDTDAGDADATDEGAEA